MSILDFLKDLFGISSPLPPPSPGYAAGFAAPQTEEERWQKALADFGFPHQLVSGDKAEEVFKTEQELGRQQGFTPVILIPDRWSSTSVPADERTKAARDVLAGGVTAAFGKRLLTGWFKSYFEDREDPEAPGVELFDELRPVPPQAASSGIGLIRDYDPNARSFSPFAEVAIMRIPTVHSYEIPVYLDWGGWNACPASLEMAAVGRYWEETHGARLVAMGSDKLEFHVSRTPANHAEAIALLKEHLSFAPENLEFDQDMLEGAAAELQVRDSWFFWWD
jgi:uncharacterized protein DUF4253